MAEKKIVIVGDSGVGKTSIFHRFTEGGFKNELQASMGANFKSVLVNIPRDEWIEEEVEGTN